MYKVLIVEDEAGIRNRLHNLIDWESLNCSICGEADSGMSGFEAILSLKPDIVLTDIVMPGINGITLLQYVRQKDAHTQFIFLTGYQEFEYAQEALRLGATALLTKPVILEELKKAVLQAAFRINTTRLGHDAAIHTISSESGMLELLLRGQVASPAIRDNLMSHLGISDSRYVAVSIIAQRGQSESSSQGIDALISAGSRALKKRSMPYSAIDGQGLCALLCEQQLGNFTPTTIRAYFEQMRQDIRKECPCAFNICLSAAHSRKQDPASAWRQCQLAEKDIFFFGADSVIVWRDKNSGGTSSGEDIFQKIYGLISSNASQQAMRDMLAELIIRLHDEERLDENMVKGVVISALIYSLMSMGKVDHSFLGLAFSKIEFYNDIIGANYLSELVEAACASLTMMKDYALLKKSHNRREIVRKVMDYIHKNYSQSLSLREAASVVFLSPSYLSNLIRLETGRNFVDIVNETRIAQACALLLQPDAKISDVAIQTGFQDTHYFRQVFKKVTGVSPSEYTRLNQ